MVSPYLERPIRTLEQALRDCILIRIRSKFPASVPDAGRRQMSPSAQPHVHVLPGSQVNSAASGRMLPRTPTDREAA